MNTVVLTSKTVVLTRSSASQNCSFDQEKGSISSSYNHCYNHQYNQF